MDGGADVGIGIELIEASNESCQQVIPGKGRRAQVLTGGPDQVHKEGGTVCKDDEMHHPPEGFRVVEKRVDVHAHQEHEPEQVGDQKPLVEGDPIIQGAVHHMVACHRAKALHIQKQQAVHRPIEQQLQVTVGFVVYLAQTESAVINSRRQDLHFLFVPPTSSFGYR